MTDTSKRSRVQAGVPTGGEFAREAKGENPDLLTGSPVVPLDERIAAYFEPVEHTPVEEGRFYVGDKFYVEVHRVSPHAKLGEDGGPVVRVYDKRYPMHGEDGQFITSSYISDVREPTHTEYPKRGWNLYGGEPEWRIEGEDYTAMMAELTRRAPTHDGMTHSLNQGVWDGLYDYERDDLVADLTSRPFADDEATTGDLIRTHGAKAVWMHGVNVVMLGDGRSIDDASYALKAALAEKAENGLYQRERR